MPTRAEFEEKKHKRSSLGTFAEKPAEPKARISLAPGAADPVTTAPTAPVRKLEEDEVPPTTPDGAKIVDYADGVAHYSDGSSYSAEGWKDSGLDVSYQGPDTVTEEQVSGRAATSTYGAKRRQAAQARAAVERAAIARERARRIEARRKQLRDRSAKQHGEPLDATYANFYGQFDKEGIKRLKDKYLWTVQDNSIEQNLVLARRLGWPTGKGKDGHTFIVTPWGNRYRGNKPKKPKKAKKARAKKKAKPQGFWHGFTSSGGTVTIEELRARVHRTPIITASASDLRARVHGSKAVMATATSAWNSSARKGAAAKGIALPDGSYPIKDKTDWAKAKQALGRAKNRAVVVKHLMKRAKALGIPPEQYKGLTASSNTGMVAAMGDWDPLLHPRARDGKFIDVGGFISAIARWGSPTGNDEGSQRAKVVRVEPNPKDPTDPIIVVQDAKHGDKLGYVEASNVVKVVAPAKGSVSKQLSLADAPVGGNKEMPDAALDGALRDMLSLATDEVEITDDDQERIDAARAALDGDGDSKAALQDMLSLVTDAAEITPADQTRIDAARSILGIDHDYTGPGDAQEPYDPIVPLYADDQGREDAPIAARLKEGDRIVFRESDAVTNVSGLKDGDVVEVFDIVRIPPDPAGKNPNGSVGIVTLNGLGPTYRSETLIELDEPKLMADDRERYDANEAAMDQRWAEMNAYRDSLTTPGKARYDELIGEGASQQEIMELFAREDAQGLEDSAAQTQADIATDRESSNIKTWRNDLKKVQDALEQGGWITSTPDADAPGGTFTYIDPDAPPELVALYQKLIQFGYANGYEP